MTLGINQEHFYTVTFVEKRDFNPYDRSFVAQYHSIQYPLNLNLVREFDLNYQHSDSSSSVVYLSIYLDQSDQNYCGQF